MKKAKEYIYEIWQGAIMVAKVQSADKEAAAREAGHYVAVYSPDGVVTVKKKYK